MFFMMGITDERKDLEYSQPAVCGACGVYSRYQLFMTCTLLSLFFIPCFRWNRRYFVQLRCCGSIYRLDDAIGKRIAAGEQIEIRPEHLTEVENRGGRRCPNCGYGLEADFEFCPKCGRQL